MENLDPAVLARFLPEFERPGFSAGAWSEARTRRDGMVEMPYVVLSPTAREFEQAAYAGGWVLEEFDWSDWMGTEEWAALRDGGIPVAQATVRQIAQVLTVLIRGDRFSEGYLLDAFKSGLILAIVRRAAQLSGPSPER